MRSINEVRDMKLTEQVQKIIKKEGIKQLVVGAMMLCVSILLLIAVMPYFKEGINIILIIMAGSGVLLLLGGGLCLFVGIKSLATNAEAVIKAQLAEIGSPEQLMSELEKMPLFDVYDKENNIIKINEDIAFFAVKDIIRAVKMKSISSTSIERVSEQRLFGGRSNRKIMYKIEFEVEGGKPFSIKLDQKSDCTNLVSYIDMYRKS